MSAGGLESRKDDLTRYSDSNLFRLISSSVSFLISSFLLLCHKIHIYIYIYIYVYIYIYICTRLQTFINILQRCCLSYFRPVYTSTCTHLHTPTYTPTKTHAEKNLKKKNTKCASIHIFLHLCVCVCVCVSVYAYIRLGT